MRKPFAPGVGGVLSADIAVPEHERELRFYAKALTTGDAPLWREDLMNIQGTPIIGLGARSPEYDSFPLQWMPHFQVSDVGASAASAVELGGQELMHGKGEDGQSQWAVLVDPKGAAFGVIPAVDEQAVATVATEGAGHISWLTLIAADVDAACNFYEQVVGWTKGSADVEGGYEMQRPGGASAAAIHPAGGDNEGIPHAWLISLPVGDLEKSLRHVAEGGGEILKGSADTGHAVIRDPVGVCVALQANK